MQTRQVDVAIIGAGSAGQSAWRAAREHTDSIALIDAGPLGTTCARVGCMPSKLLIAAAEAAHAATHAAQFGIQVAGVEVDGRKVMQRVRSERDRFVRFVLEDMQRIDPGQLLSGRARFVADDVLEVTGPPMALRLQAARIVIATGSRPQVPEAWRTALGDRLIVNDEVFDWTGLPRSVAVAGTGVVGLELAQALHKLGVRVRLLGRSANIGPLTDPALAALATELFEARLPLTREAEFTALRREGDQVELAWRGPAGEGHERFDFLLAATGRRPNTDALGLEHTSLPLDEHGMPRFDPLTLQVEGKRPVFIAGDANHDRPLLHEAADEGRIAGGNAGRWPALQSGLRRTPLAIVFSDPQIALAGRTHRELRADKQPFATGTVSFADQGRSRVMGVNAGALQVYAAPDTRRLLGAEMIGPAAEHIGHLLAWSVQRGETVDTALEQPFYHPVIEEGVRTALRDLLRKLDTAAPCEGCTPGD